MALFPSTILTTHGDFKHWQALLGEGKRMIYCVGSYGHAIALGRLAIYHLHQPQTLTIPIAIAIAIAPQGYRWALSEARGVSNTIPLITSLGAIQVWLETAPSSLSS